MIVTKTDLPYSKRQGKVRDVYDLGNQLLLVATDRISAFDVVFNEGIPNKGKALTGISNYWFDKMKNITSNAVISEWPENINTPEMKGRAVLQKKAKVLPIECIVRGYLCGSAWRAYQKDGKIHSVELPKGMQNNQKLAEPMFTPSTKSDEHDENISIAQAKELTEWTDEAMEKSLKIYNEAYKHAEQKGIIICDTKFEFGVIDDELVLVDELLTPDSSRFWYKESYDSGKPKSMDKEYLRQYLLTLDWDKNPPAPQLPQEVVDEISRRYLNIYKSITGEEIV